MSQQIVFKKVCVHNLKSVDVALDPNQLIVFTGVSGSGKSSLAFDTIYAEGQRRYVESLSTFARRYLGDISKPDVEHVSGMSPTISIEQKTAGRNPRSTVGTMTEIYDYLRVLYARVGVPHCPVSGEPVLPQSRERIIKTIQSLPEGKRVILLAPYAKGKKAEFKEDFQDLLRKGFMRARVDGSVVELDGDLALDGSVAHDVEIVIDRLVIKPDTHSRVAEGVTLALQEGQGACKVIDADSGEELFFSMHAYSPKSGLSYHALEPHDFSFNSPSGMCLRCQGMGVVQEFELDKILDPEKSIAEDCCSIGSSYQTVRFGNIYDNLAEIYHFSVHTPWKKLSEEAKRVFLHGTGQKWTRMRFVHPETGSVWHDYVQWRGVFYEAHHRYAEAKSDNYRKHMEKLMRQQVCPECRGERLKAYPAATLLGGKRISAVAGMSAGDTLAFLEALRLAPQDAHIAEELLKEIKQRLQFLLNVGLHYLTLDRTAPTLSGGEAQRVRLASQVGSGLVGVTYVLDEPSIGLHPRDNRHLIRTLKRLRDVGNTVIVVEHDEETIWEADHIVDVGPGPGRRGGEIVVTGSLKDLLRSKTSLTGAYLTGKKEIPIPKQRRKGANAFLEVIGATHHNLKGVDVKIPLGAFVAITGVSGSGKSSLITDILYPVLANALHGAEHDVGAHRRVTGIEHVDKVVAIDQTPIGRNPRSNPSTYIKLFDEIRDLFSHLPESQARGYAPGRFSFNVKEGSCPRCEGMGLLKVDMDFLEAAWVECPLCRGKRFDTDTLSVLYKGKNIYDVLEMEVGEALEFFDKIPSIKNKLQTLARVGMDYIKLGQPSTTLSGGEAQRIKLAKELVRPATGRTVYILDEPTTGLHFHDIGHLLTVLHELIERGNTVIVIEHNMEVVKTADWVIDIGPEGGGAGGQVIGTGTPEAIAAMDTPTGKAIHTSLYTDRKELVATFMKKRGKEPGDVPLVAPLTHITVKGAEQNNLKQVDVEIPRQQLTICTGPSGSGKSSLAFDTIYAEGQRRYVESLSPYARQFVKQMPKPKVAQVDGLSPAIAIEQKAHAGNPRSTVGTMTEVYDFLRILFARVGIPHCPETGEEIKAISRESVVETLLTYPSDEKLHILAPIELKKSDRFDEVMVRYRRQGFLRIRLNGQFHDLDEEGKVPYDRKKKNELFLVIDRVKVDPTMKHRLFEDIENADKISGGKVTVMREKGDVSFNLSFSAVKSGKSYPEITPHTFSFNGPEGMCPDCQGLGYQYGANLAGNSALVGLSLEGLVRLLWRDKGTRQAFKLLEVFAKEEGIKPAVSLAKLPTQQLQLIMNGSPEGRWYSGRGFQFRWPGINEVLSKIGRGAQSPLRDLVIPLLDEHPCLSCQGARLNPLARHVTIEGRSIADVCRVPVREALEFIQSLKLSAKEAKLLDEPMRQLVSRMEFLCEVGIHYVTLDRRAPTLSGGEAQRIRLARQLGSGLTGVLYVLDEPTIGLHPRDNARLHKALDRLKGLGNTLLMVEHDPLTVETADYLLDFGPQGGEHGGHITARGTYKQLLRDKNSLTGAYLSGRLTIPLPLQRRPLSDDALVVANAAVHNLKGISVRFPVGALTCLTGVSGSGKSTLLHDLVLPALERNLGYRESAEIHGATVSGMGHFDRVIALEQDPIGHTVRSDVGTYVDALTPMREFYASLPVAKAKGLQPKHFSTNHRRGMCTGCWGLGYRRVEMHFLPPIKVVCDECKGQRLNPVSLEVTYGGLNFGQLLDLTVEEARHRFENHRKVVRILDTLISVGLGYLKLGQEIASLSGGEAQRIRLSRELAKRSTGRTLYLLDEPTTGLHADDINKLLKVLHQLVDKGNTMVIIEHNLDMIKNADYLIDLGPEAGDQGGRVIATGTPEEVAKVKGSYTGTYLKKVL